MLGVTIGSAIRGLHKVGLARKSQVRHALACVRQYDVLAGGLGAVRRLHRSQGRASRRKGRWASRIPTSSPAPTASASGAGWARAGSALCTRSFDRDTGALLALKVLKRGDAPSLYRFKREFRALADVTHPNLVALYELISEGGRWFFTMELVEGVDSSSLGGRRPTMAPRAVRRRRTRAGSAGPGRPGRRSSARCAPTGRRARVRTSPRSTPAGGPGSR